MVGRVEVDASGVEGRREVMGGCVIGMGGGWVGDGKGVVDG